MGKSTKSGRIVSKKDWKQRDTTHYDNERPKNYCCLETRIHYRKDDEHIKMM
jgi:hypothetical protein